MDSKMQGLQAHTANISLSCESLWELFSQTGLLMY
jgi:hypothetical protein